MKDPLNFSDHSRGSHPRASIHNRRLVLKLLYERPMTRSQLSEVTGLRTSTITYIVRDLIQNQIVRTVGKVASQAVGRKQILVEVNPNLGWSVGIGLGGELASLAYVDASRNMIDRDQFDDDVDLEVGLVFSFADAGGGELPGMVIAFDDEGMLIAAIGDGSAAKRSTKSWTTGASH